MMTELSDDELAMHDKLVHMATLLEPVVVIEDLVSRLRQDVALSDVVVGEHVLAAPEVEGDEDAPGLPRAFLAAVLALASGRIRALTCGGEYGVVWRVEWSDRFSDDGPTHKAVLNGFERTFMTAASEHEEVLAGLAVTAVAHAARLSGS